MRGTICGLFLWSLHIWGEQMATITTSTVEAASVRHLEAVTHSDGFAKIVSPIAERIIPFVEHYRSGHTVTRPVIAIAGCSGVGKSHFANQLLTNLQKIGINAKILRFDDFIDPEPFEGAKEDIHPHFDYRSAHTFFKKIADGEQIIEKLTWDLTGPKPVKVKENYDLRSVELLIFEGEFTLCDETTYDFVKLSNVRIAIDAEDKDIINWDWRRARDLETTVFAEFAESRAKSLSKYRRLLEPLIKQYADFLVTKEEDHHYILKCLTED
jgi:uridine kinase